MIIYYDTSGKIHSAIAASSATTKPPANPGTPLYLDDTTYADVWNYPSRYLIINNAPVLQSYFTTTTSTTSGTTTLTVTLNNPPATPPTSATLTVAGGTISVPLTANVGNLRVTVDANLTGQSIPARITANGCVGTTADLGTSGGTANGPIQVMSPGAPGNPSTTAYRIATTSEAYILGYEQGQLNQAKMINAILVMVQALIHTVYGELLPQATASAWAPLTTSTNRSQALTDIQTNILPSLVTTLESIYPSSGSPMALYQAVTSIMSQAQTLLQNTESALANTPNLE